MKILLIGSGGREHVLAWKIKQSPLTKELYCAPGNAGIAQVAECIDVKANDFEGLLRFAKDNAIDLTVVGPEAPLVDGIVNAFHAEGLKIFGPTKVAAQLEGSKVFAKEFMRECNIPTAPFMVFTDVSSAKDFLDNRDFPVVIKADGLAAGKGVYICEKIEDAHKALKEIMEDKIFEEAGNKIIIEECLQGEEASILAISDGDNYVILDSAQDHKRIFDDDLGPNTGGMGAYSPAPIINEEMLMKVGARVIDPAIRGMRRNGEPFIGILYAGLMITASGPVVLEFNVRFGDPEAQAVLPRLNTDLVEIMLASCEGKLHTMELDWDTRAAICVVMSSGGYPGQYLKGFEITGLDQFNESNDVLVFHAGTAKTEEKIVTDGGRVLGVTCKGDNIEEAIENVYEQMEKIKFEKCFFRRDIGAKALKHIGDLPEATGRR